MKKKIWFLISIISGFIYGEEKVHNIFSPLKGNAKIKGFVIDLKTKEALPYATCILHKEGEDKVLKGILADDKGFFLLKEVPPGRYSLRVDFVGYKEKVLSDISVKQGDTLIDLNKIELEPALYETETVEVTKSPLPIKFEIDKKVINLREEPLYQSGTALEVLRNIPSLNVDVSGNVSLRRSENFQVFIDGKKTGLEPSIILSQIPASSIDKIEIITNPSAKYDPEGTSGILNIILKRGNNYGLSIISNLNVGMYGNYGGDILFSLKKNKLKALIGFNYNKRRFPNLIELKRTIQGNTLFSKGEYTRGSAPNGLKTEIQYNLKEKNIFSISANLGEWSMLFNSKNEYLDLNKTSLLFLTESYFEIRSPYIDFSFNEKTKFSKTHEFSVDFTYSYRKGDEYNLNYKKDSKDSILSGSKSEEKGQTKRINTRINYIYPFLKNFSLEIGGEEEFSKSEDMVFYYEYDPLRRDFGLNEVLNGEFFYKDERFAPYLLFKGNISKLNIQSGLRVELTDRKISFRDTNFDYILKRWDYFPSIHVSFNLKEGTEIKSSYTRRIRRPRPYMLEPFITWMDAYNVRKGNPDLKPEYMDNYEFSLIFPFLKGTLIFETYLRELYNAIEMVRLPYNDSVLMSTNANVGTSYTGGLEVIYNLSPFKFLSLNFLSDFYYYILRSNLLNENFKKENSSYNLRLNINSFLTKSLRFQTILNYEGERETSQGKRGRVYFVDLSLQKLFLGGNLSLNLQVRDIFGTSGHLYEGKGYNYYFVQSFNLKTPLVFFTITYNFNNFKYEREKRKEGEEREPLEEIEF